MIGQYTLEGRLRDMDMVNPLVAAALIANEVLPDELLSRDQADPREALENRKLSDAEVIKQQKDIFNDYKDNRVLVRATRGEESIEHTLERVSKVNSRWRRIIPRFKNEEQNYTVRELSELVGYCGQYESRGVLRMDNVITGATLFTAAAFAIVGLNYLPEIISRAEYTAENIQQTLMMYKALIIMGIAAPLVGGWLGSSRRSGCYPIEEARYIDKKIKDLDITF